jgi:hypothetical protein
MSTRSIYIDERKRKEFDFARIPDFSQIYQVNYVLHGKRMRQQITGTLLKEGRLKPVTFSLIKNMF